MVRPGRDLLSGEVEVNEAFLGGVEEGAGGRHLGKKALVMIAAEVRERGIGRIRLGRIMDSSAASILPFVRGAVAAGSMIITDGLRTYRALPGSGYDHPRLVVHRRGTNPKEMLPRVHRVAALLKRWLLGTHQGAVARQHLPYYRDEFTFRCNRRTSQHRGMLFFRLVQPALAVDPVSYRLLRGGTGPDGPQDVEVT